MGAAGYDAAALIGAVGGEMARLEADLIRLQGIVGGGACGWPRASDGPSAPPDDVALRAQIVATQDLDRVTQTAGALAALCGRLGAHLAVQRTGAACGGQGGIACDALQAVGLVSLRTRLERALGGANFGAHADPADDGDHTAWDDVADRGWGDMDMLCDMDDRWREA